MKLQTLFEVTMKNEPKPQKAIIYARFSPRRNADDSQSIDAQINSCENYCKFHNIKIHAVFSDAAISGKNIESRPEFLKALDEVTLHHGILVCYSLSRMSRSLHDAIKIIERLKDNKAHFISVSEKQLDTTSGIMGEFIFYMFALIAQFIREQSAEQTRDKVLFYQSQGRRMSKNCPWGWEDDPDDPARMIPNEYERDVIREVIKLREEGWSMRQIADQLNERGYEPREARRRIKGEVIEVKGMITFSMVRCILKGVRHGTCPNLTPES